MLTYTFFEIREDGRFSVYLRLPCFAGEGRSFTDAARMNRFYESAAGALYRYAKSLPDTEARRTQYSCTAAAEEDDTGVITVTLQLSFRQYAQNSPAQRKTIIHRWKNGVLLPVNKSGRRQKNSKKQK
ncbi:MAG: hypothetical protein IJC71_07515 [Clostridia bacterium]|nr:hypothetical protein [Clostridia bacterium]